MRCMSQIKADKESKTYVMFDQAKHNGKSQAPESSRAAYPNVRGNVTAVLIAPNEASRRHLIQVLEDQNAAILANPAAYPSHNQLLSLIELDCDAYIIEVDSDTDRALEQVETICSSKPSATVIVYSRTNDPQIPIASMRAGAREFLSGHVPPEIAAEALLRAAARRAEILPKRQTGKMLMFWGAKGGSGTTTLATNFALALRRETGGPVGLLDFHPQLGDVAVLMGLTPRFTVADALRNPARLDEDFISTLVTDHSSGLSVLAAPDAFSAAGPAPDQTVRRMIQLFGTKFPYFVVDAGPGLGTTTETLFQLASTVYLVSQPDIPSLRNSQRLLAYLKNLGGPAVELVLNRFEVRKNEFTDERLRKAIGEEPKWKVPNDYANVRRAANNGTPFAHERLAISSVLQQMARAASGKPQQMERRKGAFGLFG